MLSDLSEFGSTIKVNAWCGAQIRRTSDRYPVRCTPTDQTFSIWGAIYSMLFLYSCTWKTPEEGRLFRRSMRLNRRWVRMFTEDRLVEAQVAILALSKTNNRLMCVNRNAQQQFALDLYGSWVECAAVLNTSIVKRYVDKRRDDSVQRFVALLRRMGRRKLRSGQLAAYTIAIRGIRQSFQDKKDFDATLDHAIQCFISSQEVVE